MTIIEYTPIADTIWNGKTFNSNDLGTLLNENLLILQNEDGLDIIFHTGEYNEEDNQTWYQTF